MKYGKCIIITTIVDAIFRPVAEQIFDEYILPLPAPANFDEVVWTDRLLLIMKHLDEQAVNLLLSWSGLKGS